LTPPTLHLFEGYGIELEYMIVDRQSLAVLPVADEVIHAASDSYESEIERGPLNWSNELVLHVIELKTNGPAPALEDLPAKFQRDVAVINGILAPMGGILLPTAMHPWMDPHRETRLWPHEYNAIYEAYDRIFGCQGHGWSNLQSLHINLPFAGDEEFGRLHAAIRVVLPLMPALAASSPIMEGQVTGLMDNRLEAYRQNQRKIPILTNRVIPEPVYTRRDYAEGILGKIYRAIAPYDTGNILKHEWLNSRGAIARFERNTIEIRVLDIQETPWADLAVAMTITRLIRDLIAERWVALERVRAFPVDPLADLFVGAIRDAEETPIADRAYLGLFGYGGPVPCRMQDLWAHVAGQGCNLPADLAAPLKVILEQGPLARRIVAATGREPSRERLQAVYRDLADCLAEGRVFGA